MGKEPYNHVAQQPPNEMVSTCDDVFQQETQIRNLFKQELAALLSPVKSRAGGRYYKDLTKYLYLPIIPEGSIQSGAELAEILFSGIRDDSYTIPRSEVRFVDRNLKLFSYYFSNLVKHTNITHVSVGCGPYTPVVAKDVLFARASQAESYTSMDINCDQAQSAAELVKQRIPGIKSSFMCGDFTSPFSLRDKDTSNLIVMTMFGGTIGQFPENTKQKVELFPQCNSLEKLLINFGKATNYKALLLATLDSETHGLSAVAKYQGHGMTALMQNLWRTAKEVTGDEGFDTSAFSYRAEYDDCIGAVLFVHTAKHKTSLTIDDEKFCIPKGTEFVIGCSQKTSPEQILMTCKKAGWSNIDLEFSYDSTVRAVLLAGKGLSKDLPLHIHTRIRPSYSIPPLNTHNNQNNILEGDGAAVLSTQEKLNKRKRIFRTTLYQRSPQLT